MDTKIVFCGVGGQGIILLTRFIGEVLTKSGFKVISTESHGMATRGGSVISFMKIGNFKSPLIKASDADIAVVLHPDELDRALFYAKKDALLIGSNLKKQNLGVKVVELSKIMENAGINKKFSNMVCAGILLNIFNVNIEDAIKSLEETGKAYPENIKALKIGYAEGIHVPATA